MANINFSLDNLKQTIKKAEAELSNKSEGGGTPIGFLPEGTHKIRFFFDPTGETIRTSVAHRINNKNILCPDYLAEHDPKTNYPPCAICSKAKESDDWKLNRRFNVMIYGHVYSTTAASDYWKADNTCVIIGNTKLRSAVLSFLKSLVDESEDYLMAMLNPQVSGGQLNVTVVKGAQGSVSITPIPGKSVDPIELGDWWKPLGEVYLPTEFSRQAYIEAVTFLKSEDGEEGSTDQNSKKEAPKEDKPKETPKEEKSAAPEEKESAEEPEETKDEEAQNNVVMTSSGTQITLPSEVVGWGCWTKYQQDRPECVTCDINVECMTEGL